MIENIGKYYLYRYIRLDKNIPFYIGIGTKTNKKIGFKTLKSEYHRAYQKHNNKIYNNIISKTDYEIEIIIESDDYEFIKQKEIEFISLYGRINDNTGILCNLTDGGNGSNGLILSKETRLKIGNNNHSKGKFGKNNLRSKKAYQYDLEGNFIKEWDSVSDISRYFKLKNNRIPSLKEITFKGYQWKYEYHGYKINPVNYKIGINKRLSQISIPVYQYSLNKELICIHKSYIKASNETGFHTSGIHNAANRENNVYKGYIWSNKILN